MGGYYLCKGIKYNAILIVMEPGQKLFIGLSVCKRNQIFKNNYLKNVFLFRNWRSKAFPGPSRRKSLRKRRKLLAEFGI